MEQSIINHLPDSFPWKDRVRYLAVTGSTNTDLKELARQGAPHGTALIAGSQTAGRGRMGRGFESPEGQGVYLSLLLRPQCPAASLMHLTCAAAVAMCEAVEHAAGFRPGIKWTNDLVFGKQKLGGILTELSLAPGGMVEFAIIGIGINCCQQPEDFPPAIKDIAASLTMVSGKPVSPVSLAAEMLCSLYQMDQQLSQPDLILNEYRCNCITLGKEISLVRGQDILHGKALDIDEEGALLVEFPDGTIRKVNSGEVSVRGMYGYV